MSDDKPDLAAIVREACESKHAEAAQPHGEDNRYCFCAQIRAALAYRMRTEDYPGALRAEIERLKRLLANEEEAHDIRRRNSL